MNDVVDAVMVVIAFSLFAGFAFAGCATGEAMGRASFCREIAGDTAKMIDDKCHRFVDGAWREVRVQ